MKLISYFWEEVKSRYRKSLSTTNYRAYQKAGILAVIAIFVISLIISLLYHSRIIGITLSQVFLLSLIPSIILTSLTFIAVIIYPNYRINTEKKRVEEGLIYTVSYMTVLANCGFSVDRIFGHAADIELNPSIRKLMTSFILDIKLLGYDIEQGLRRLMEKSPSKNFSDILNSISNASWSSGDLKEIMRYHFDVLDKKRKDETENMINSLTILSEIYVALMVIAPIMLIIMFTLLSVLMSGMNDTSTISILNSITFILLPFVGAGFLVILDTLRGAD